jgi:hypothetical protein
LWYTLCHLPGGFLFCLSIQFPVFALPLWCIFDLNLARSIPGLLVYILECALFRVSQTRPSWRMYCKKSPQPPHQNRNKFMSSLWVFEN